MNRFDNRLRKPDGAKSLARLIAEEAFSRPAPKPAANAPVVRVIGRRLSLADPATPPAPMPAPAVTEAAGDSAKKPRVFVIRPQAQNGVAGSNGSEPAPPEAETAVVTPQRRRRAPAPAPVQVIYSAPERPAPPPVVSLETMAGSLAGLEPTLDIIRRAMDFDFTDPAIVAEWEQLSRAASELSELMSS